MSPPEMFSYLDYAILYVIISLYMLNTSVIHFFTLACPALKNIPHVLLIHGESDAGVDLMKVSSFSLYMN